LRPEGPRGYDPSMDSSRVSRFYDANTEEGRFENPVGRLEYLRSKIILERFLPPPPATVVDIGGATGAYAFWLTQRGYRVSLADLSPAHVEIARRKNRAASPMLVEIVLADARALPFPDASFDAALLMGPLYHILERSGRLGALREANRVLKPGGFLAAACISRFASLMDGYRLDSYGDPAYAELVRQDLASGRHIPPAGRDDYFTEAYLHDPGEIPGELAEAGFAEAHVLAVEGFGWQLSELDDIMDDPARLSLLLDQIEATAEAPSLLGASAHLLALARKGE